MKTVKDFSYIKQRFIASKTNEDRKFHVSCWINEVFTNLGEIAGKQKPAQNQRYFMDMYRQSKSFCNKPVEGTEWFLDTDWIKIFIAQAGRENSNTAVMFNAIGWDYETAVNPVSDDSSCLKIYEWQDGDGVTEMPLLLVSRGTFAVGSRWTLGSGKPWAVQFEHSDSVEIINESHSIVRTVGKKEMLARYRRGK